MLQLPDLHKGQGWLYQLVRQRRKMLAEKNLGGRTFLRLIRSLYGHWLPCGGVSADWLAKAFEGDFAELLEEEAFAYAQVGNCIRYQNLFRLRVGAQTRSQLNCRSEEIVILFYRLACCGADSNLERLLGVRLRVLL